MMSCFRFSNILKQFIINNFGKNKDSSYWKKENIGCESTETNLFFGKSLISVVHILFCLLWDIAEVEKLSQVQ